MTDVEQEIVLIEELEKVQAEVSVAVILLSYNRPRMVKEALRSIKGQSMHPDQLIVVDDGSDFNIASAVRKMGYRNTDFIISDKISPQERVKTPRVGKLLNSALKLVTTDVVAYLCDDDLFHPNWIENVKNHYYSHSDPFAKGLWYVFEDGNKPDNSNLCPLDYRGMTTGNFVHLTSCFAVDGIRWNEGTLTSHDDAFLNQANKKHKIVNAPYIKNAIAGYRRLHKYNALNYSVGHAYKEAALDGLFGEGYLEE